MSLTRISGAQAAAALDSVDAIVDARSESEYAEDRLPGAQNWPSLSDEERRIVGTQYRQVSAFEARRLGAVMVARNIARHLEQHVQDKPIDWRVLVYCWRGGKRSGTLAWFLDQIGFRVQVVEGGYRAFRAEVIAALEALPATLNFKVVCGRTGSGKTRLLHALRAEGAQVLDLEGLAVHRGSVLGVHPGRPQPSQKAFETGVWQALRAFDPARPVYVESESRQIGRLRTPLTLIERMRKNSPCVHVQMPDEARVQLLLEDYAFFADHVDLFCRLVGGLVALRGKTVVEGWQAGAREGRWAEIYADLMHLHYDPSYLKSMQRNFVGFGQALALDVADGSHAAMTDAARRLIADDRA